MDKVIVLLLISLIALSYWNLVSLRDIKKHNRSNKEISDDRYYELKYKIEFIVAIAVVVIGGGTLFGVNWFNDLKKDISNNFKRETDLRFDTINSKLKFVDSSINRHQINVLAYESDVNKLHSVQIFAEKKIPYISKRISVLDHLVDTISNKNIVKLDFFIIGNLKINTKDENTNHRFYYKDLKTIVGNKLPNFKTAPFLVTVPENDVQLNLKNNNREYFEIVLMSFSSEVDTAKFSVMISQK